MRTITSNELPDDFDKKVIIKSGDRTRHQKNAAALERTLLHCSEVRANYESQTVKLRESCEKQGFETGFELFFSQLTDFLEEYYQRQCERQAQFHQHIHDALRNSLHDSTIVERIIHHLQEKCGHQKAVRIILPSSIKLDNGGDAAEYLYTDDNHITIQNDMDAIRFPSEALCKQWIAYADESIAPFDASTQQLIPELLCNIADRLIGLSQQPLTQHLKNKESHDE